MQLARPAIARDPRQFGRGRVRELAASFAATAPQLGADARLFAATFLAGFVFVSVLIA